LPLILERAWGKPDQRGLLDEGHVNSITICFVEPDGIVCDPETLWRERPEHGEIAMVAAVQLASMRADPVRARDGVSTVVALPTVGQDTPVVRDEGLSLHARAATGIFR
jgi:hypothetical protein